MSQFPLHSFVILSSIFLIICGTVAAFKTVEDDDTPEAEKKDMAKAKALGKTYFWRKMIEAWNCSEETLEKRLVYIEYFTGKRNVAKLITHCEDLKKMATATDGYVKNWRNEEARRKRKEWRQERAQKGGLTPKSLKQSEAVPTVDGERPSTQAAESEPSTSAQDLRPRSSPTPLSATPIRRHVRVRAKTADKGTHMDFTTADKGTHMDLKTMDKATDVDLAYEDAATQTEQLDKQLKEQEEAIGFLRQQVRNRDAMITALRRQLEEKMAPPMETLTTSKTTPTGRPKMNADHLQRTSRRKLADQIADVINRDRSRSASRASLERISREVRHKFAHYTPKKKKQQQPRQNDSVDPEDALLILGLVGTQKAYRRLKATIRLINAKLDVFPPLKKVLDIKRRICGPLQYAPIETNVGVGFVCTDVEAALEARLLSAKDNLITFGGEIYIKLSGDHGQSCTKITVSFSQAARSNSPSNNFVCAVFPAKDSRENLERYGSTLWEQIDGIGTLAGKRVKWFMGGDVSFIWSMIGHCGSAVTTFPSPICGCRSDHLVKEGEICELRTIGQTVHFAEQFTKAMVNGEKANAAVRSAMMGITKPPLLLSIGFDRIIPAPFHVFQGLGNALIRELEQQEGCAAIAQHFFRRFGARREQFRKRDMTGNSIRKILVNASEMEHLFSTEWPITICRTLVHLGKIQKFSKAEPLSPNDLDELEERVDDLKSFLAAQERMRGFLSKKPKAHLLLSHFVPFAREHKFLGLLDEQGDEALHSVWRRLEQLWKCMPDADQILQQLEHHFVNNWLLDTGKIDEMKQRQSDQREENDEFDQSDEETDEISLINVID
ncbi:hypothetical protein niasHT_035553 [Heterodera trifolii]|uniref:Uncharacterized protein n=1 Tax=Heterodera trifolii TaxID=157864 RepID=A0ABD2HTT6_9BILA